ncbi:hypothetical protein MOUN0_N11232 [Monosporozyma unispora]
MSGESSSITVAVRVRPFTHFETLHLTPTNDPDVSLISSSSDDDDEDEFNETISTYQSPLPNGIWKLVDCVDDKMLIFDPENRNPLNEISANIINKRRHRRKNTQTNETRFIFDKLFDTTTTQSQIYNDLMIPLLDSVMMGYNGTIFAYGATGCGKTYTISGTREEPGIIYRTMTDIFERINDCKDEKEIKLSLSFCEIYNENIIDLLRPETPSNKLIIREDGNQRIKITNLSIYYPETVDEVLMLVSQGNMNRTTHSTNANNVSSRSHSILQITIEQTNNRVDLQNEKISGILSIIDLAGSERAAMTKNRGERLIETGNINKSLLSLGNCINSLCQDTIIHVPYRDSKLTRLLQFSLGGNCKTVMIVCISPSSQHYDETLNTLKYANRAKNIKTKIIKNEINIVNHVGSYVKMIQSQKVTIEKLLLKIEGLKNNTMREDIMTMIDRIKINDNNKIILQSLILVKRRLLQLLTSLIDPPDKFEINTEINLLETRFNNNKEMILNEIKQLKENDLATIRTQTDDDPIYIRLYENETEKMILSHDNNIFIRTSIIMEDMLRDNNIRLLIRGVKFKDGINLNEINIQFNIFSERYLQC